jgi:hypothetical protein
MNGSSNTTGPVQFAGEGAKTHLAWTIAASLMVLLGLVLLG